MTAPPPKPDGTLRVLHLSDIHVSLPLAEVPFRGWLGKRVMGAANLILRRGKSFGRVREKLHALERFRLAYDVDLVICTGDYTALGTDAELAAARVVIDPLTRASAGFVTVPGNHDVYVSDAIGRFESFFGDLLETDLPEHRVEGSCWPLVRLVGDSVAVVAVNSARPNPQPWRSSGRIPDEELRALSRVLADPRVKGRFTFVITHYAPRLADGTPDRFSHGLVNANALLSICAPIARGAILHGHVHRCYQVSLPDVGPPIFGAGSTTQEHREGFWLFDVGADHAEAARGTFLEEGEYGLTEAPREFLG